MKKIVNSCKKSLLPSPIKSCKVNSCKGFTLAEILISLVILGVIAALTIPTLIQNTQKKEEVVKIKKGLSMINQAILMDKSLTENDLSQYSLEQFGNMLKKRLSVVDDLSSESFPFYVTQDGLIYSFWPSRDDNYNFEVIIITLPPDREKLDSLCGMDSYGGPGNLNGGYQLFCDKEHCIPSDDTAAILNAADPTKVDSGS